MKELSIPRFKIAIIIKKADSELMKKVEKLQKEDPIEAAKELVLNCLVSPNLKDPKFQEDFSCISAIDVVAKIFQLGEIKLISDAIMKYTRL